MARTKEELDKLIADERVVYSLLRDAVREGFLDLRIGRHRWRLHLT